jgi:hypothetical protein
MYLEAGMWAHHNPGQEPVLRHLIVVRRLSVIVVTRLSADVVAARTCGGGGTSVVREDWGGNDGRTAGDEIVEGGLGWTRE